MRRRGGHGGRARRALAPAAGAAAALLLFAGAVSASSRVEAAATTTCTCSKTGPYVNPAAGTAVSGAQTSSAHGTYTATWANGDVTVRKGTATVLTTQGTAGGFSPDEHAFVTESLTRGVLSVHLYNLTAASPGNQIFAATPTVVSSTIAFSPSGHYLLLGYTTASQTFLQVADTTVESEADQHAFGSGGLSTSGAPGSSGDGSLGLVYGFGPDDSRFVYAYLSSPSQAAWRWVDLKNAPQTIHSDATSGSSAYAQFSPCGDVLAIVNGFGSGTVAVNLFDSSSGTAVGEQWSGSASSKPALDTTATEQRATIDGVTHALAANTCTAPSGGGGGGGGTLPATGDFVDPKPGTLVSGQQATSSKGTYTASWSGGNVTVRKAGVAVLTTAGTTGGFSPDEHAFVAETLNGATSSIRLFDLKGTDPGTAIWNGGATVTSEQLVFSPSSRYLLHAYTTSGNQVHFELVDATATGTTTPVYATSVSTATGAPTGATGTPFGTVAYGFGPDDSRFVFGYATSGGLVDWTWADLSSPPVQARAVQNLVATSSYVQFTPCGNALAVVSVASNGTATVALDDSSAGASLGSASGATGGQAIALEAETADFTATIGGTKHTLAADTCASSGGGTSGGPQASFTAPSGVVSGVAAQFTDTSTDDSATISAWSWDFGDGTGGSNVQSPTHAFAAAGTYTVKLTVTDGDGATSTVSHGVVVSTGAPHSTSFGSAWGFPAGAQPWSVAIGDLNGDGKADVAAANLHSDTVSVFRGDGAGGLAAKTDYGTGKNPGAVAIADLNGDGSDDLVLSSGGAGSVTVLLADGNGGFGAKQTYATGESPFADKQLYGVLNQSIAVADLNGDGKLDVAVTNGGSNTVSILLGDGAGALGTHADIPAGVRPESVAIGDLNGDGKPDLAVAATGSDSVSVLLGDGSGGFGSFHSFAAGPEPSSVAIGDFDGDGNADVAVAAYTGAIVSVLLGDGSGGLAAKTDYAVGSHPELVAVADLDGDGVEDIAVANGASDSVSVLRGDGDGGFGTKVDLGTGKGPLWVAAGDLDGDGAPDLATADSTSDTVSVLLDLGAAGGGLRARFTATPSSSPGSLQVDADASDSTGSGLSYAWSFGDGSDGSGVHAQHAYTAAGAYTITLTVTADGGATAQVSHTVTVPAAPPPAAGPGALTQLPSPYDCIAQDDSEGCGTTTAAGIDDAGWVAASPDGRNVYVAAFDNDAVAAFGRAADGSLRQLPGAAACVGASESGDCGTIAPGISRATSLAVSPDGRNVYVTGDQDETVMALTRNADGSLSPLQCVQNVNARFDRCATKITGLDNPYDVTVSPDGKNVYVAAGGGGAGTDGAIVEFARAADGTLTQLAAPNDCIEEQGNATPICGASDGEGLLAVTALAVSPDGANLYAVSDTHYIRGDDAPGTVTSFTRDPDTGALTQLGCIGEPAPTDECETVTAAGLSDVVNVAISPDGKNVYTASDDPNGAIAEFHREDDGSLTALGCAGGGSPCTMLAPGLAGVFGLAVSPDGQNVYAAAAGSFNPQVAPGVVALSRAADGRLTPVGGAGGCIEQEGASGAVCANTSGHGLADALGVAVSPDGANVYTAASGGAVAAFSRDSTQAADGGSLTVTTTLDSSDGACTRALCSLRDAVEASNAAGGGTVTVPAGHYVLTHGPLFATSPIEIDGDGADTTVIDGNDAEQVVRGSRDTKPSIALADLTVTGGHSQQVDAPDYNEGGGIISWGPLTLTRVAVVGNTAYADGGGLNALGGLTIVGSTIADNHADGSGGGIRTENGVLSIVGSTIARNTAQSRAALELFHFASATIASSTIAGNANSAGFFAAVDAVETTVTLRGTAIANDLSNGTSNCGGSFASDGHNLATDGSCGLDGPGDQARVDDAGLGALDDNGGPTETMLPQPGSPLIDAGGTDCPDTDQRGEPRPAGAACDIGAVEAPPSANEPPVADIRVTPSPLPGSLDVTLDGSGSTDSDGEVVTYAWAFGDGSSGSGATVSHTYALAGTYTVSLTVTDADGAATTLSRDVTVPASDVDLPPAARFVVTRGAAGSPEVSVDASGSSDADGPIASYAWDFGDGGTATGATAAHTYLASGTFTIRLTVTDGAGTTATAAHDVTVPSTGENRAPTASFGFPSNADPATLTIALDGRGSSDPDGTIASYAWDWGDGSAGSGVKATHTYDAEGDYTVALTVTDDAGATGSFSRLLHVPVRLADSSHSSATVVPGSVPADGSTAATVTVTMRDEHGDPISGLDVRLHRSSGVGTIAPSGSVQTDTHGVATFAVTSDTEGSAVLEADDLSDSLFVDVVDVGFTAAGNDAPSASFTATPSPEPGSLAVAFDGSASTDADGSVADWAWNFGDGSTGSGETASHAYALPGTYTVTLTVTDDAGATATATREVTVPASANLAPTASFVATPSSTGGLDVAVDASGSSDEDGSVAGYAWDFGDGGTATGVTASHTYLAAGTFEIELTVTDDGGATATVSHSVTVPASTEPPEPVTFASPETFATGTQPWYVAAADLDGDGDLDLVAPNLHSGNVSVLLGDGTGGYADQTTFAAGKNPGAVAVGDLNGDGAPDLAVTDGGTGTLSVLLGDGDGGFGDPSTVATGSADVFNQGIAMVDLDNDHDLDVAVANGGSSSLTILSGTGSGGFTPSPLVQAGSHPELLTAAELDGDTLADLAVAVSGENSVAVVAGRSDGDPPKLYAVGANPSDVAAGDLNGDGALDLAVTNYDDATVSVLLGDGEGGFGDQTTFATGTQPESVAIGDLNLDGKADLAISNGGDGTVSVLLGDGAGGFAEHADTPAGGGPLSLALADLDGNGALDIAVADSSDDTITVLLNESRPLSTRNEPPAASFTATRSAEAGSLEVAVDASASSDSDGEVTDYAWDFGDGGTGTGADASHVYAAAGTYTVTLTVTDDDGATASVSHDVTVPATATNAAPTASFVATFAAGSLDVAVDASASSDADGTIASYSWDFGDGSAATGATASHTYETAGTYTVTLTVTDDGGATATVSHDVTLPAPPAENRPPEASFTSSTSGLEVSLDASGSSDEDGSIASYAWDFGDGSTGDGETPTHAYDEAGTYTVQLTVTDDGGATATVEHEVTVAAAGNGAPQASFTATPSDEAGSLEVAVDASGSSDEDGSIASYAWDFGDGSSGSGKTATHDYAAAGTYTIALTVTDDAGATATASHDVTVPATAESESPVASFEAEPSEEPGSFEVAYDASGSTGSIASYAWDFGDGASGTGATTSHTYDHAGTYTVALTVTGDGGATATVSHDVGVPAKAKPREPVHPKPPAPRQPVVLPPSAAFSVAPASGDTTVTWTFDASSSSRASSYAWDFGDGGSASGTTASHVFARPGTYTVRLTASGAGGSASAEHSVTVAPRPPRAAFYYLPARPVPGRPMGFIADTTPVAGGAPLVSYAWDFGDGTTAAGARAGHIYLSSGSFRVTLTVTDTAGQTATAAIAVAVAAADAPSAMFVYEPMPVGAGADTAFGGIAIRRAGTWAATRLVGWSWSFGDGTTATGQQVHHVFAREGSYRVQLTVTDASGAAGTVASAVVVKTNVVAVDETVSVADTATVALPPSISVVEPIVVSDAPALVPPASLDVTENVGVSDVPGVVPPAVVVVDESWGFTDSTVTAVHH